MLAPMPTASPQPRDLPLERADLPAELSIYFADHCRRGVFFNPWQTTAKPGAADLLRWHASSNPWAEAKRHKHEAEVLAEAMDARTALPAAGRVTWLGHASILVQIDDLTVLIDPIFGKIGGLLPRAAAAPVSVAELPPIDAVLISHGHYDHLDAASLRALSKRFGPDLLFATPLGLSRSLPRRCRRRVELDWWQSIELGDASIHLVPAQHWHKRTPLDTNRALWGGWVIRGGGSAPRSVYHSGDTGYFGGFAAIGHVFPHVDLAVLPIGAWEPRWFMQTQHMNPDDTVRALQDLGASSLLAMHWGTFDLTDEPLDEGPRALRTALKEHSVAPERAHVLAHGGSVALLSTGDAASA
jgi:L-ascorbate metabolism protein UlaG (beta-lactamase superfamily)